MPATQPRAIKRKANNSLAGSKAKGPVKIQRTTLDAFFAPRQTASGIHPGNKGNTTADGPLSNSLPAQTISGRRDVGLSAEQEAVLRVVVNDEQNIFFTGSAGKLHFSLSSRPDCLFSQYFNADYRAGTGKSLLLRAIIKALQQKYANKADSLAICASTGMAAQNIGGSCPDLSLFNHLVLISLHYRDDTACLGCYHAWRLRRGEADQLHQDMQARPPTMEDSQGPGYRRRCVPFALIIDALRFSLLTHPSAVSMVDGQLFNLLAALSAILRKKTNRPFGGIQVSHSRNLSYFNALLLTATRLLSRVTSSSCPR